MILYHSDKMEEGQEFIVTGDKEQLKPKVCLVTLEDLLDFLFISKLLIFREETLKNK